MVFCEHEVCVLRVARVKSHRAFVCVFGKWCEGFCGATLRRTAVVESLSERSSAAGRANGVAELEMPSAAEDAEFNEEATETSSSGSEGGASILNR